jgi:small-conductance mechanosensitive channel
VSRIGYRVLWGEPSLDGRVPAGDAFAARWKALDREEQQWVREQAYRARRQEEADLRALVAGYAWRELTRLPRYGIGVVAVVVVFAFLLLLAGAGPSTIAFVGGPFGALLGLLAAARRLAAAVANNVGPPPAAPPVQEGEGSASN